MNLFSEPLLLRSSNVRPSLKRKRADGDSIKKNKISKKAISLTSFGAGGEATIFASKDFKIFRCEKSNEPPQKWLNSSRIVKSEISQKLKHKHVLTQEKHPNLTSMSKSHKGEYTCSISTFGIDLGRMSDNFKEDYTNGIIERKTIIVCMCTFFTQIHRVVCDKV